MTETTLSNPEIAVDIPTMEDNKRRWPNFSSILRYLGAFCVVGSGIIYLLQGLADADMHLRYWGYLALILVLAGGGMLSFKRMHDEKGARLFFGLASLLVPVQFAQLGAMTYSYVHPSAGVEILSAPGLAMFAGISLVLGSIAAFSGLSILARPYAKLLTLIFLGFNALLLLPQRDITTVSLLVTAMGGIYYWLQNKVFKQDHRFQLTEGKAAQAMLITPMMIMLGRVGFYVGEGFGLSMLTLLVSLLVILINQPQAKPSRLNRFVSIISYLFALSAWFTMVDTQISHYFNGTFIGNLLDLNAFILTTPMLLLTVMMANRYPASSFYRIFAGMIVTVCTAMIFASASIATWSLMLLVAAGTMYFAIKQQSVSIVMITVTALGVSLFKMIALSIGAVDMLAWVALAIAGILLVAFSSVIERHGQLAKAKISGTLTELKTWRF